MRNPLFDTTLPVEKRLDWLLDEMTMDEKLRCFATTAPAIERLGIPGFSVGGEAAHGVVNRNDQNGSGVPDITTSFVQPIGMSATWDPKLIREAGEVAGTEARVVFHRHPHGGLSRWAPTVDLERDPRWGRTEEGYGEDPLLTGVMASAYIRGMQGDDPEHLRIAATLKHFYGNNTEVGRGRKSSSIDPRNRYELYLEPFRRCICDGHAEAVMTAYNKINGIPGMLNPEVRDILKRQYGLRHAVCDGGAMELCTNMHHYFGTNAETFAAALKAGVDAFPDKADAVEKAAREAFDLGLVTRKDLDNALRNVFRTRLRLGLFGDDNPYDNVTEADIDSPRHRALSRRVAQESIVLLKNENHTLPLRRSSVGSIALIGPLADTWNLDWYGGIPPYRTTLREGLERELGIAGAAVGSEHKLLYCDGYDRVIFRYSASRPDDCRDGANCVISGGSGTADSNSDCAVAAVSDVCSMGVTVSDDGSLLLSEHPDVFLLQDWGGGNFLIRCERSGKYWNLVLPSAPPAPDTQRPENFSIKADSDSPFDWLVTELMHLHDAGDGRITLTTRMDTPISVNGEGMLFSQPDGTAAVFTMEIVQSGLAQACALAQECDTVILALGCNPVINAKEEVDRSTIALPPAQEALMQRVFEANPNMILTLFSNYPYSICQAQERIPAIVWSATGSQDMGSAMTDILFGKAAPAGRLNMSWYRCDDQLPDIDDYDIIKNERTYRYFRGKVLYPFGHGLTYTDFAYSNLSMELTGTPGESSASADPSKDLTEYGERPADPARNSETAGTQAKENYIRVAFDVFNTGGTASDEVAQVYAKAPPSRAKKPLLQLLGFRRIKNVLPGETRHVELLIPVEELRFYDVISETLMVEEGEYQIFAGRSSQNLPLQSALWIPGARTGHRLLRTGRHKADHYDDYENILLTEGHFGYTAVTPKSTPATGAFYQHTENAPDCAPAADTLCRHTGNASNCVPTTGTLVYRDCELPEDARALWLHLKSRHGCSVEILVDGQPAGNWSGSTRAYDPKPKFLLDERSRREDALIQARTHAVFTDVRIALTLPPVQTARIQADANGQAIRRSSCEAAASAQTDRQTTSGAGIRLCTLTIRISGDIRFCFFRTE